MYCVVLIFFFFKQKTAYEMRISDWSSDVCSSDLYQLYQYVVGFEVHRYLDSMDGAQAGKPELIMALDADDPTVLLGFALYLPFVDDPEACALVYLAVDAGRRRQGIGRAMVEAMVTRYPQDRKSTRLNSSPQCP